MDIIDFEPLFSDWTVDSFIGAGSFGKVYKIKREEFGTVYYSALKWISIPKDDTELKQLRYDGMDNESISEYYTNLVKDLSNELKLMRSLRGRSSIVSYEDHRIIAKPDRKGYDILIRMELLTSLNDYMLSHALSRAELIRLGINICEALELCQRYNIIHRDVKPDNVFVTEIGDFKLGDFGIARQLEGTMSGLSIKGTYDYMAPEVYKRERYSSSIDVYSLGILIYRLLNDGRLPFLPLAQATIRPSDRDQSFARRMSGEAMPPPRNAEGRLGEIVLKACAYDPKDRYSSPKQMREELQSIQFTPEEARMIFRDGDDLGHVEPSVRETETEQVAQEVEVTDSFGYMAETYSQETQDKIESGEEVEHEDIDKTKTSPEKKALLARIIVAIAIVGLAVVCACLYGRVVKISINATSYDMEVGSSQVLLTSVTRFLKGTQYESVQWAYDESVVSLDGDGTFTAIGEGEALIEAHLDNVKASCTISAQYPTITLGTTSFKTNSTELDLSDQGITDISPLSECRCLTSLDLSRNPITSLEPLQYVSTLEYLNINETQVVNLEPLGSLKQLKSVDIRDTQIPDLSPLSDDVNVNMNMNLIKRVNLDFDDFYSLSEEDFGVNFGGRQITWTSFDTTVAWCENGDIGTTSIQRDITKSMLRTFITGSVENTNTLLMYIIHIPCETYSFKQGNETHFPDNWIAWPQIISPKIENCYGFAITINSSKEHAVQYSSDWYIYIKDDEGWERIFTIYIEEGVENSTNIKFDAPLNILEIALVPKGNKLNGDTTWYNYITLSDLVFARN